MHFNLPLPITSGRYVMDVPTGAYYRPYAIGQRVIAQFGHSEPAEGVITSQPYAPGIRSYGVQFEPCGAHYQCSKVSCYGDANGWTEKEYRVAREMASSWEHARGVEAERIERYPEAPFSPAFQEVTI